MEQLQEHVGSIPPLALLVCVGVGVLLVRLNQRRKIEVLLFLSVPWMFVQMAADLPTVDSAAKVTSPVLLVLLAVACWRLPGERRPVPPMAAIYVYVPAVAVVAISSTTDAAVGLALQVQFLVAVIAAWKLARISTPARLPWILQILSWSMLSVTAICFIALVVAPDAAFRYGRLAPWDIGPNWTGLALAFAVPLFIYRSREGRGQHFWRGVAGLAVVLLVLTGSRTAALALGAAWVPTAMPYLKRANWRTIASGVMASLTVIALATWMAGTVPNANIARYSSFESERSEIMVEYLRLVEQRPFTGLLFTEQERSLGAEGVGRHAHNVFLIWAYLVGVPLAALFLVVAGASLRKALKAPPTSDLLTLSGLVWAGWISGLVSIQIHNAGSPLALVHTFVVFHVLFHRMPPLRVVSERAPLRAAARAA